MRYAMANIIVGVLSLTMVSVSSAGSFFDVSDSGNVGIGTTAAGALLDVARPGTTSNTELIDIRANGFTQTISSGLTNARFNLFNQYTLSAATAQTVTNGTTLHIAGPPTGGGAGPATITTSSALRIAAGSVANTTNAYGLYVDAPTGATNNYAAVFPTGNVGIGTTSPAYKLDVQGAPGADSLSLTRIKGTGDTQANLLIDSGGSSAQNSAILFADRGSNRWQLGKGNTNNFFLFDTANAFTALTVQTATGNVGIGETAPGSKLSVSGGATIGASYDTTAAPSNGMIIEGNVGIGTTSPGYVLDIGATLGADSLSSMRIKGGDTQVNLAIDSGSTSAQNSAIVFKDRGSNRWQLGKGNTNNFFLFDTANAFTALTVQTATGNVGIGTTSPGNILTVVQSSSTDPIADAWTTYSSIRWKEHVVPFSGALNKIEQLRTVYFDWKQTKQRDVGMIAEEVGAVLPEVVAYEPNGKDAKSIDYGRLTAVLVQAIKEQQVQIRELQKEIAALKHSQ